MTWQIVGALALAVVVTGCSPERDRSGQIFVVTQGGVNVKMGLVGVHVVTPEELRPIAAKLVQEYKGEEAKRKGFLAVSLLDQSALKEFEAQLGAMEPTGLAGKVDEIRLLKREAEERLGKLKVGVVTNGQDGLLNQAVLSERLMSSLPGQATKTDADGRFSVRAKPQDWLLARAQRKVGNDVENYVWNFSVTKAEDVVLISNDSLLDGPTGLYQFLVTVSGASPEALAVSTATESPDLVAMPFGNSVIRDGRFG